jgi:hypothetical protein
LDGWDFCPSQGDGGNRNRFKEVASSYTHYPDGETQRLRFRKAGCLLWKLLKENLLDWWD